LALRLARIVQDHPELVKLIEAWPSLVPELRAAIVRLTKE
jgi:hypothetical protein